MREFLGSSNDSEGWVLFYGRSDDAANGPKERMLTHARAHCTMDTFPAFQINCSEKYWRRFTYANSWQDAFPRIQAVESRSRHAYEIVRYGRPCKPYLDFDMKEPPAEWTEERVIATLAPLVLQIFRDECGVAVAPEALTWSSGSRPGKLSLHLVVSTHAPQVVFATNRAGEAGSAYALAFRLRQHLAIVAPALVEGVDKSVYSKDREMRLVGSTKCEARDYPLRALGAAPFADHCITWLDKETSTLTVPSALTGSIAAYNLVDADEKGETFSTASLPLPKRGFVAYKQPYSEEWVEALLRLISPSTWRAYDTWLRICMAMKSLGMPFDLFDQLSREFGGTGYGGTRETWRAVRTRTDNTPSMGTICHLAKESDPIEYARLVGMPDSDPRATLLREAIQRGAGAQAHWSTRSLKRTRADGQTLILAGAGVDARVCGAQRNDRFEGCAPYALVYAASGDVCVCCNRCRRTGKRAFVGRLSYDTRRELGALLRELE